MPILSGNVTDQNGAPVGGALVYVYDSNGTLAPLSDFEGQPVPNPVVTGEDGFWDAFVAVEGFYKLSYWWGGRERKVIANELAGLDPLARAEEAAAFAEAFAGPAYDTRAAGEAATTPGQIFRVWNGDSPRTYTPWQRTADGSAEVANANFGEVAQLVAEATEAATDAIDAANTAQASQATAQASAATATAQASAATSSASSAAASAVLATSSAATASANAAAAENFANAAELAADAAALASGIYATEAEGRAAVADGVVFAAVGAATDRAVDIWQRVNAGSSTLLRSYPSLTLLQSQAEAGGVPARKGQIVADLAEKGYALVHVLEPTNNTSNVGTNIQRWAKGYDAHASVDDDTRIKAGRIISTVATFGKVPATATHIRARVWRREATENGLPGGGYDTLIADTGAVALGDAGITYVEAFTGQGFYVLALPKADHFEVALGFCYVVAFEFLLSGMPVAATVPYKQLGSAIAQRLAGYQDTTGSWANTNTSRPICISLGESVYESVTAVAAKIEPQAAAPSLLTPAERLFAAVQPWSRWKYPGVATASHGGRQGLANALGMAAWAPGLMMGQEGVDFGHLTPEGLLADLKLDPRWLSATNRLRIATNTVMNAPGGFAWRGGKLIGGYVDVTPAPGIPVLIEDCLIEANGLNLISGISQPPTLTNPGLLTLRNVTVRGHVNNNVSLTNAALFNCYLDFTSDNNLTFGTNSQAGRTLYVERCLMRRPGNSAHPNPIVNPHADNCQFDGGGETSIVGSVLYMPTGAGAGASGYDEGVVGATASIMLGTQNRDTLRFHVLGCIIGAGQYNAYFYPGANRTMRNVVCLNNIWLGGGTAGGTANLGSAMRYNGSAEVLIQNIPASATVHNFCFFGNVCADGYPFRIAGNARPALSNVPANSNGQPITVSGGVWVNPEGIFNYSWAEMDDKTRELLLTYGRERGEWIIDPVSKALNPKFDLGTLVRI